MILEFSDEAENDVEQIVDYIAERNPQRALSCIRELRGKCEELVDNPSGFSLVPRYERHSIRRRVHGDYLIFYRIDNEKVVIIHILHGATEYGTILFGE